MVADILEALSSDFWVQLASALIASLLTLLIQPNWYKSFKRSDPAAEKSSPRTYVEAPKAKFEGAGHIPSKTLKLRSTLMYDKIYTIHLRTGRTGRILSV